jgi:hypothetical protein
MKVQILSISLVWGLIGCGSSSTPPSIPTDPLTASGSGSGGHGSNHGSGGHHMTPVDAAPAPESPDAAPDPEVIKAAIKAGLMKTEMAAFDQAKPVFDRFCANCHVPDGKKTKSKLEALEHFNMASYPYGGHHADDLTGSVRKVLGLAGKKATMPKGKPGIVKGDDLAAIVAWADAFDASMAGGAHEDDAHGGHGAPAPASPETAHPTDGHAH